MTCTPHRFAGHETNSSDLQAEGTGWISAVHCTQSYRGVVWCVHKRLALLCFLARRMSVLEPIEH